MTAELNRYWVVAGSLLVFFLAGFLLVEALGLPGLTAPPGALARPGPAAALIGVGLLVADALLPVPSSLVMVGLGATYGVALGFAFALVGRVAMTLLGFGLGRSGSPLLARYVPVEGRDRADRLLDRWGATAIVVTRPVPLLGETVVILAGASPMSWRRATLAAVAGCVPEAVLYASAGAAARGATHAALVWLALLVLAAIFWRIGH